MIYGNKLIQTKMCLDTIKLIPKPDEHQIQPASLDLRLGSNFFTLREDVDEVDTMDIDLDSLFEETVTLNEPFVMPANSFALALTKEWIELNGQVAAHVDGRSSFGRIGLGIHVTAGFIDPGFKGKIVLELTNSLPVPIKLYPNQRICQLIFENVSGCDMFYGDEELNSHYQNQENIDAKSIRDD